jgi:hypothetical protein
LILSVRVTWFLEKRGYGPEYGMLFDVKTGSIGWRGLKDLYIPADKTD